MNHELVGYLFKTRAIRVCPKDKPFWYTSGKIGPYYVNTHFLYGSEEKANLFLDEINRLKDHKLICSEKFHKLVKDNYLSDPMYKGTIDFLVGYIKNNIDIEKIDYVSGGERRDWFFSFLVADILDKPHITLFKDNASIIYKDGVSIENNDIIESSVLHVADLITSASSYERAWVPAINKINGLMKWSLVVVDRLQGGSQVLENLGVESNALIYIDSEVFEKAYDQGYIDKSQLELVQKYLKDPEKFMNTFIKEHPNFLSDALEEGGKVAQRAKLFLETYN